MSRIFFIRILFLIVFLFGSGLFSTAQNRDTLVIDGINVDVSRTTTGCIIWRSNSPSPTLKVWGQIGCTPDGTGWLPRSGQVLYRFRTPTAGSLPPVIRIFYSKHSENVVVRLTPDDQIKYFTPQNQWAWNRFSSARVTFTRPLPAGEHILQLYTDGLQYGALEVGLIKIIY